MTLYEKIQQKIDRNEHIYSLFQQGNTYADIQRLLRGTYTMSFTGIKNICVNYRESQDKLYTRLQDIDKICSMYAKDKMSIVAIAEKENITRQAVSNIIYKKYKNGVVELLSAS